MSIYYKVPAAAIDGGIWEKWEEWKRQFVMINEDEANKAGNPASPICDFSGCISRREVPALEDGINKMQWYWDSSHFKK